MNTEQLSALTTALNQFAGASKSAEARCHAHEILQFAARVSRPWSRATLDGHLTASAWVLDKTHKHAAMIHHRKLGRWLQPGGHIEDEDVSCRAAAQREVTEELGLTAFIAMADDERLFDVDVHAIPARTDVPEHFHYDLRFLFVADVDAALDNQLELNTDEAHDCRWFPLTDRANDPALEPSLRRMVELSIRHFS